MHRLVGETQQINRWSWERRENYARFKMAEALDIRLQKPNKVRLDKKKSPAVFSGDIWKLSNVSVLYNSSAAGPSAQAWTTTLVPCSCILFKLSPLVCPSSQSQERGRTQGMIKRGRLPPFFFFFFFLIYRGKKCPCVGSFDPRSFIWCGGFYWPWNSHFPFHRKFMKWECASCYTLAWKSTGEKNKTSSKLMQRSNDIWPGGEMLIRTDFPLIKSSKILIILINNIIILIFFFFQANECITPQIITSSSVELILFSETWTHFKTFFLFNSDWGLQRSKQPSLFLPPRLTLLPPSLLSLFQTFLLYCIF